MSFSIKELELLSGIKAHTIRIWEQRYGFLKPSRTSTNIRTYSNEELKTLLTVTLLNKYGYKISRIDAMSPMQRDKEVWQLQHSEAQNEHTVNQLIGSMVDLDIHQFESILHQSIQQNGLQQVVQVLIFSFLERVGILWQVNRIHPVHEHIVSNIIRQKIIAAIDALPSVAAGRQVLLFLPEGEFHELGLLYVHYLLKSKNKATIYLGASVPIEDIYYINKAKQPSYLYLHLTTPAYHFNFHQYLLTLSAKATQATILISGGAVQEYKKALPKNIVLLQSLPAVIAYIAEI